MDKLTTFMRVTKTRKTQPEKHALAKKKTAPSLASPLHTTSARFTPSTQKPPAPTSTAALWNGKQQPEEEVLDEDGCHVPEFTYQVCCRVWIRS